MSRAFHLGDILSVTHDRLVSPRRMEGVYEICNFLTGDNLFTHQLIRAHEPCKLWLLTLHPGLSDIPMVTDHNAEHMLQLHGKGWWGIWLGEQIQKFGESLECEPIPAGIWEHQNPIEELVKMVGPERVIVVNSSEDPHA